MTAAAPRARLTYFAGWGLAEQTRWMLAAADVEWEQVSLQNHAQFLDLRSKGRLLFGQLPLLEIDGLDLVQSQAMVRYVGRRGGMAGKTPAEEALVDMVCDGVKDARGSVVSFPFEQDQNLATMKLPQNVQRHLDCFEVILQRGSGQVVASGISTADVLLGELGHELLEIRPDALDRHPFMRALHDKVVKLPGVDKYLRSTLRYPLPRGDVGRVYVANVGQVLGR
mmetsp:Transcript_37895/g.114460  ORF Transcript_37895/g.114460 Transcript_37895/m.114460 type:complete len:225 (-) Transcript_37895:100-774(-)